MGLSSKFYFRPGDGSQIDTTVHIRRDSRAAVSGRVVDPSGSPVEGALCLLVDAEGKTELLLASCYTDESGCFAFGQLEGDRLYLVRVYKDGLELRALELKTGGPLS